MSLPPHNLSSVGGWGVRTRRFPDDLSPKPYLLALCRRSHGAHLSLPARESRFRFPKNPKAWDCVERRVFFPCEELAQELQRSVPHFAFENTYWKVVFLSYSPTPLRSRQRWVQKKVGGSLDSPRHLLPWLPSHPTVLPLWPRWSTLALLSPRPPQDSQYPWSQRVSFAKDIASGMVSRLRGCGWMI